MVLNQGWLNNVPGVLKRARYLPHRTTGPWDLHTLVMSSAVAKVPIYPRLLHRSFELVIILHILLSHADIY